MDDPEVEGAAVRHPQREFEPEPVKRRKIQVVVRGDASFHLEIGRDRLAGFREMLIDLEVIVHASDAAVFLEELSIANRLLDESLHVRPFSRRVHLSGTQHLPQLRYHGIRVRVRGTDHRVRARNGYVGEKRN